MKRSRPVSVVILAFTVIAGGALLLKHTGIFAGAFRTEILARVDDRDVVRAANITDGAALSSPPPLR
ncbi:hypothetical protein CO670_24825 [Rhizobium sp. J15]|uniref:hypothetical protein n=1 Tax=Rhizobium sp. J15 TaxID=2035450 RepID=UPI000BEAAF5D|nr:hypothetical protein [Rhizobium sp. J15]PDT14049.1 hypothetical protein CO670_24825 [Rhizobium sp. J15]